MKQNSKLILSLMSATLLGSSFSLQASSQNSKGDVFIPSTQQEAVMGNLVNTASARASVSYPDFTKVAENCINSVVSIKNYQPSRQQQYQQFGGDDFFDPFEFFFGDGSSRRRQQQQKSQKKSEEKPQLRGSGSGVIISADGYIVTNNHVIDGAEKLTVTLNDNSEYNARVIGTDPSTDIALIKISAKNLKPATFANSDEVKVGEWALAIGNPFGFNASVTSGIVSAKARGVTESSNMGIKAFIQHDAAANPGNSGGALVNIDGQLIGINTMIYSQTGNYAGISFAIPSNTVKKVVTDLKQYGTVQRAVLGVSYRELDAELAKEHKITVTNDGIYVAKVTADGAAEEAGLKEGDVIVKLNGNDVKNSGELQEEMNKLRPGDKAEVAYYRNNKLRHATITFKNNEGNTKITKSSDFTSLGCTFMKLSGTEKDDLKIKNGVKVKGLKRGKFKAAGVEEGFIITDINNMPVNSQDDVEEIYNQIMRSKDADKVMFVTGLTATGKKKYIGIDIADE